MKAVFVDRDGVLNELVVHAGSYESPHGVEELEMIPSALQGLRLLQDAGFALFVVSNQPSYAKGKASMEALRFVADRVAQECRKASVMIRDWFYCFHHPEGVVPELATACDCRKPAPGSLKRGEREHGATLRDSWMVGDQDIDVQCGQAAGCRTVQVLNPRSASKRGKARPDFEARDFLEAARVILAEEGGTHG